MRAEVRRVESLFPVVPCFRSSRTIGHAGVHKTALHVFVRYERPELTLLGRIQHSPFGLAPQLGDLLIRREIAVCDLARTDRYIMLSEEQMVLDLGDDVLADPRVPRDPRYVAGVRADRGVGRFGFGGGGFYVPGAGPARASWRAVGRGVPVGGPRAGDAPGFAVTCGGR